MRFRGVVKSWNDARGFGFIEADQGGQEIFLHVKALRVGAERPQANQEVTFEIELNRDGKKRARKVEVVRPSNAVPKRSQKKKVAGWGTASIVAIPAFALVYLVVALLWHVPGWVAGVYGVASVICFAAYALDKSAAISGRWRIAESTLLLLGFGCGWPGAILAQQVLRHKSNKASFRSAFWGTVALNVVVFVAVHSPVARWLGS